MDAAFEEVDLPVVFKFAVGEIAPLQAEVGVMLGGVFALVADIVDGEQTGGAPQDGVVPVPDFEVGGCQRGLPVVDVDHIGLEGQVAAQLQPGAGQKPEAAGIVGVIVEIFVVVEARSGEVLVELDEIDPHARGMFRLPDSAPLLGVAHPDPHGLERGFEAEPLPVNLPVKRHDDDHLVPQISQCPRQRADHVGKPAGFGVGHTFRGDEGDFERWGHGGFLLRGKPKGLQNLRGLGASPLRPIIRQRAQTGAVLLFGSGKKASDGGTSLRGRSPKQSLRVRNP